MLLPDFIGCITVEQQPLQKNGLTVQLFTEADAEKPYE